MPDGMIVASGVLLDAIVSEAGPAAVPVRRRRAPMTRASSGACGAQDSWRPGACDLLPPRALNSDRVHRAASVAGLHAIASGDFGARARAPGARTAGGALVPPACCARRHHRDRRTECLACRFGPASWPDDAESAALRMVDSSRDESGIEARHANVFGMSGERAPSCQSTVRESARCHCWTAA